MDDVAQVARITPEDAYARAERVLAEREGRDRPTLEILRAALDELHRVTVAIHVDGALGWPAPPLILEIRPSEPELVMALDADLTGLQLGRLQEILGQNLDWRFRSDAGVLEIFCPSVEALDRTVEADAAIDDYDRRNSRP